MAGLRISRLLKIVGGPALLFASLSSALAIAIVPSGVGATVSRGIELFAIIIVPDALATWWLLRRLWLHSTAHDARRGATAFAFTAPLTLSIGYVLGELVGGWTEVFLGRAFILPTVILFTAILMTTIPGLVVTWAMHPAAGVMPLNEGHR